MAEYNGWTNYETWAVKLWIDNDEGEHTYWYERACQAHEDAKDADQVESGIWTVEEAARFQLSAELVELHEDQVENMVGVTGVFADLMHAALDSVNWDEIARSILDLVEECRTT